MSSTGSVSSGTGLVSGTDYSTLISKLMSVAEKPVTLLEEKISAYSVTLSAYSSLSSDLSSLQTALDALTSSTDGFSLLTATSGDETVVTGKAASGAATGSYSVTVNQLAALQKVKSCEFSSSEAVGAGTLTLTVGGQSTDITVGASDTISDVAGAINKADTGVTASVVNDGTGEVLMLKSSDTGTRNAFTISVNDSDGGNTDSSGLSRLSYSGGGSDQMTLTQAARDASATIDGVDVASSSNTISTAVKGVTFTLKSKSSSATTVDVTADASSIESEIQAFVDAYNKVADYISTEQGYDSSTSTAGHLLGDSTTNRIKSRLQSFVNESISGTSLSDLGITVSSSGDLELNSDALDSALSDNFDVVKKFFADGSQGLAVGMADAIGSWVNSDDGILTERSKGIQNSIDRLDERKSEMEDRLSKEEDMLTARFNALETLLSSYSTTASSVDALVTAVSNLNSKK